MHKQHAQLWQGGRAEQQLSYCVAGISDNASAELNELSLHRLQLRMCQIKAEYTCWQNDG